MDTKIEMSLTEKEVEAIRSDPELFVKMVLGTELSRFQVDYIKHLSNPAGVELEDTMHNRKVNRFLFNKNHSQAATLKILERRGMSPDEIFIDEKVTSGAPIKPVLERMKTMKIVSDGTIPGTKISVDDVELKNVSSLKIQGDVHSGILSGELGIELFELDLTVPVEFKLKKDEEK